MPKADVFAIYGSSEAEPISLLQADARLPHSFNLSSQKLLGVPAGRPTENLHCRVVRDCWGQPQTNELAISFTENQCSPGETGEIIVSGNHVVQHYWGGYGENETKVNSAGTIWHRTGDAGFFDLEGNLWLCGRCSAAITWHNRRLYPFQIEALTHDLKTIARAALASGSGTSPILWLERKTSSTRTNLASDLECLRQRLTHLDLPDLPFRLHRIPVDKRHNAKVDYQALAKLR